MREIKFKYIWQYQETGRITSTIISLDDLENVAKESNCISFLTKLLPERLYSLVARCEFTGLTDKNGKEIFEGDILKLGYDHEKKYILYINWSRDHYELCTKNGIELFPMQAPSTDAIEVLGNIYENPELLNGEYVSKEKAKEYVMNYNKEKQAI